MIQAMAVAVRLVIALALTGGLLSSQSREMPAFDVASVKPNRSGDTESASFVQPGGRYTATNVTLRALVKTAYTLHDAQIIGGPSWIDADRFDVAAKAEGYSTPSAFRDRARLMLRPLLADRFKLALRPDRREIAVYSLELARADGRFGLQFGRSDAGNCSGPPKAIRPAAGSAEPEIPLPCGAELFRLGHLAARGMAVSNLAFNVSRWTDRVVVDRTGLEGPFDWDVQWVPDPLTPDSGRPPDGPSLFAALRDQAGLKLEGTRAPVEVLIVERAERPEPD